MKPEKQSPVQTLAKQLISPHILTYTQNLRSSVSLSATLGSGFVKGLLIEDHRL